MFSMPDMVIFGLAIAAAVIWPLLMRRITRNATPKRHPREDWAQLEAFRATRRAGGK